MRLISYQSATGPRVAGLRDGQAVDLNQADSDVPHCMKMLLAQGSAGLARAGHAIQRGQAVPLSELKLLAPVPRPEKVICVGLNYADHAKESGAQVPGEPVIFTKFASAVSAHGAPIVLPAVSSEVDYEAELVVVIGRGGRNIAQDQARSHVAGYCCGNDVSARDWQLRKPGGQWLLGKSFDTFAPFGPALVTADEVADPNDLRVQTSLERPGEAGFADGPVHLQGGRSGVVRVEGVHAGAGRRDLHRARPQAWVLHASRRCTSGRAIRWKSRSKPSACSATPWWPKRRASDELGKSVSLRPHPLPLSHRHVAPRLAGEGRLSEHAAA